MSTTLDALQSLDVPPLTVAALTLAVAALVASDPVLGRRDHRRLLADVAADPAGGEAARLRFYRRWVRGGWLWAAAAVALVAVLPGVGLADLGLRAPDLAGLGSSIWRDGSGATSAFAGEDTVETIAGMVVGFVTATVLVVVVLRLLGRRRARAASAAGGRPPRPVPLAGAAAIEPMLPTTSRGRRGWAALATTAGITEEVTYRGVVVLTLALLLPTADARVVVVAAAVLFGLAHAYQGRLGMLVTAILGAAFAGLYLTTGSLVVPMVLHVLVDLRALLLTPRTEPTAEPAPARASAPVGRVPA
jgi:membrane protease YdiL (CAAX protease family)